MEPGVGVVALVEAPAEPAAVEERLAALPGVAGAEVARPGVVTAQLTAAADEDAVAEAALDAFAGTPGVTVGGPAVAGLQSPRPWARTSAAPS